jgi:HTH DNA binding domain
MSILERSQVLHLLRLDAKGYLLICRLPASEWSDFKKMTRTASQKISVKFLGGEKTGNVLLQVSGFWRGGDGIRARRDAKMFEFFRSMERSPLFTLENPTIDEHGISFSIVGERTTITDLLTGLKRFNVQYRVHNFSRLKSESSSVLGTLTKQQARVLKLAHTLGYYDIPRRQKTEDIARILEMDAATIGEHLRRAEKHVFDKLLL